MGILDQVSGTLWGRRQAFQPGCYCNTWCGDGEVFVGCWGDGEVLVDDGEVMVDDGEVMVR